VSRVEEAAPFRWRGIDAAPQPAGRGMTRQVLFAGPEVDVRYFELEPGGHTPLERHRHTHRVIVLRGRGACLVGTAVHAITPHDLILVPSWDWHQFRADRAEPLGFLCIVPSERDAGVAPGPAELEHLRAIPAIADFLSGLAPQL
jgi:quercetin dioxygenase-like cupin family protein